MKKKPLEIIAVLLLIATPAWAQFDRVLEGLGFGQKSGLSDLKIGSGLKDALKIGTKYSWIDRKKRRLFRQQSDQDPDA